MATKQLYSNFSCTPTIGHPSLTTKTIDNILKKLDYLSEEHHLYDLKGDEATRLQVLALLQDFFRDIPGGHSLKTLEVQSMNESRITEGDSAFFYDLNLSEEFDSESENEIDDMTFLKYLFFTL